MYKFRIPDSVTELVRSMHPRLKKEVREGLERISSEPYCGKELKDDLSGLRSLRIRRFRIIYRISETNEIEIVAIGPRDRIYEETSELIYKKEM